MVFRHTFILAGLVTVIVLSLATIQQWPSTQWLWLVAGPLLALGTYDLLQNKHTLLRIYPVIGHFRYLFESVRRELQQYFVESDL
ncbi:MAG: FMN-binding glutamate synthase family protein, partial [Gammaproteobacteria bacterium HGW-Gammaproteobacteria-6]